MFSLGREERGEAWSWRRRLFVWEEGLLGECRVLLINITFQVNSGDHWKWNLDPNVGYYVWGANELLVNLVSHSPVSELIWHNDILLKVSVFAWHFLRNWLPTKDNIFRRGMPNQDSRLCVSGCGVTKSTYHLFLNCNLFDSVWQHSSNEEVPLKFSIFVWRLLRDRIPTMDNLIRRQILQPNMHLCVGGCGKHENIYWSPLFILRFFWKNLVWYF